MGKLLLYIFIIILAGEMFILLPLIAKKLTKKNVLSEVTVSTPSPTPTQTPSPTPTPTVTESPSPTPIGSPKPSAKAATPVPRPKVSAQEINGLIDRFSAQYNVSPHILRHIALCESGFNPEASHAGYAGLYQFGATTWKNLRKKMGDDTSVDLRFNSEEAIQTAAYVLSINNAGIWPNCVP